jgi:hypothetical protein
MNFRRRGLDQRGLMNVLLIPFILVVLLLIGAVVFGVWAYQERQDYKDNVNSKITVAVGEAVKSEDTKAAAKYAEESKYPLKTYSGPSAYGGLQVQYPKTWSAYVVERNSSEYVVDGYFHPNFVPDASGNINSFALRVRVSSQSYAQVVQNLQGFVKSGKTKATPFAFAKVPNVVGTRFDGELGSNKQGSLVVVPLRANALLVSTEVNEYMGDFNNNVLPNLSFSP